MGTYNYIYCILGFSYIFLTFHSKPFDKTEDNIFSSLAFRKKFIKGLFVRNIIKISTQSSSGLEEIKNDIWHSWK